jgi:hypothetical protein
MKGAIHEYERGNDASSSDGPVPNRVLSAPYASVPIDGIPCDNRIDNDPYKQQKCKKVFQHAEIMLPFDAAPYYRKWTYFLKGSNSMPDGAVVTARS